MYGDIQVRDVMPATRITLAADAEILRAAHTLAASHLSGAPVVDDSGRLLGILTEKDCIRAALDAAYHSDYGGMVGDFMTTPALSMSPDDGLIDAARRFLDDGFHLYPVVDDGFVLGCVSRQDVLGALAEAWQWR